MVDIEAVVKSIGVEFVETVDSYDVRKVEDVMNVGDTVKVKVTEIDAQNRINLSRKELL